MSQGVGSQLEASLAALAAEAESADVPALDPWLTSLEEKARVLREIIQDEHRALDQTEESLEQAAEQERIMRRLLPGASPSPPSSRETLQPLEIEENRRFLRSDGGEKKSLLRRSSERTLPKVTAEEFAELVPRTGRISRAILNDALRELETLGRLQVTEHELRQKCAFFRNGEATARTILALLKELHRVKQEPNKNGEIVYWLL